MTTFVSIPTNSRNEIVYVNPEHVVHVRSYKQDGVPFADQPAWRTVIRVVGSEDIYSIADIRYVLQQLKGES